MSWRICEITIVKSSFNLGQNEIFTPKVRGRMGKIPLEKNILSDWAIGEEREGAPLPLLPPHSSSLSPPLFMSYPATVSPCRSIFPSSLPKALSPSPSHFLSLFLAFSLSLSRSFSLFDTGMTKLWSTPSEAHWWTRAS